MRGESTRTIALGVGALVLLTLATYLPALGAGFVWDDDFFVTRNEALRTLGGLRTIWFHPEKIAQYYPIVHTSFWIEYHLWGLAPRGYHLVNVLLHGLGAALWWRVLARLALPGAWLAAAIFAVHPVHVESVAWVSERKNVLSGVFYLAAALAWLHLALPDRLPPVAARRRLYGIALISFTLALLSKSVTCSLPAALLLVPWWKRGRLRWRDVVPLLPMLALGIALGIATTWMEKAYVGARGAAWTLSFVERVLIAGRALWFYAGKLLWPHPLLFVYPRWQVDPARWIELLAPAAAAAVVLGLWLLRSRIGRGPLVAVLFFAGTLFPALGFFDLFPMQYSFVADHFQYLASMGLIALAVASAAHIGGALPAPGRRALAAAVVLVLATLAWRQTRVYHDMERLWRHTIAGNPAGWMPHYNLAIELREQGRMDEAAAELAETIRLKPDYVNARVNLGLFLIQRGRIEEAMQQYTELLRYDPDSYVAHFNLGWALVKQGKAADGIAHYRAALRVDARDPALHYNLGMALEGLGRREEALAAFRASLARQRDAPLTLGEMAWILATDDEARVRDGAKAVKLAERAARLPGVEPGWVLNILAAAYAETGQFERAVATATRARQLALASGNQRLASVIDQRLQVYASGRPYHAAPR